MLVVSSLRIKLDITVHRLITRRQQHTTLRPMSDMQQSRATLSLNSVAQRSCHRQLSIFHRQTITKKPVVQIISHIYLSVQCNTLHGTVYKIICVLCVCVCMGFRGQISPNPSSDRGSGKVGHQQEMAYGESIGHVIDDIT